MRPALEDAGDRSHKGPVDVSGPGLLRDGVDVELDGGGQDAEDVDVDALDGSLGGDDEGRSAEYGNVQGLPIELTLAKATLGYINRVKLIITLYNVTIWENTKVVMSG